MSFNVASKPMENLFLNTLKFEFPAEPVTFYFSDTDLADAHFTYLKSSALFPVGIRDIFPNLKNNDTLYTLFTKQVNGVNGVILLPDNWISSHYSLNNANKWNASYSSNHISQSDWSSKL